MSIHNKSQTEEKKEPEVQESTTGATASTSQVKQRKLDRNLGFTFEPVISGKEDNEHLRQNRDSKEGDKHGKEERQQDADPKATYQGPEASEHEPNKPPLKHELLRKQSMHQTERNIQIAG